jgi:hypothetical protein
MTKRKIEVSDAIETPIVHATFEAFTEGTMKDAVFWDVMQLLQLLVPANIAPSR